MRKHTPARLKYIAERTVIEDDGCWTWTLRPDRKGYGRANFAMKSMMSHRFTYETFVDSIPDGLQIDHLCRNTACVNPDHLEPVTCQENVARSNVPSAVVRREGRCARDLHPMSGPNLYVRPDGRQGCRTCAQERRRERARSAA